MQIKEILIERVLNLFSPEDKKKYADVVWDMLQTSYKDSGGFKSAVNVDELINDSSLWKIITRGEDVTAVSIYKDSKGRKAIASGTNGTKQGSKDYKMIRGNDDTLRRAWAEVSGKPEEFLKKKGAIPIPSKFARFLTRKEILKYNPDGVHYTRLIQGAPTEKVIYGFPSLSNDDLAELERSGISIGELPDNFRLPS